MSEETAKLLIEAMNRLAAALERGSTQTVNHYHHQVQPLPAYPQPWPVPVYPQPWPISIPYYTVSNSTAGGIA